MVPAIFELGFLKLNVEVVGRAYVLLALLQLNTVS
jgi:hypothetical protein